MRFGVGPWHAQESCVDGGFRARVHTLGAS